MSQSHKLFCQPRLKINSVALCLFICLARSSTVQLSSYSYLRDTMSLLCRFLSWSGCRRSIRRRTGGCWDSCWWPKSATVTPSRSWTRRNANTPTTWTKATTSQTFWSRRERGEGHFWFFSFFFVFSSGCMWCLVFPLLCSTFITAMNPILLLGQYKN